MCGCVTVGCGAVFSRRLSSLLGLFTTSDMSGRQLSMPSTYSPTPTGRYAEPALRRPQIVNCLKTASLGASYCQLSNLGNPFPSSLVGGGLGSGRVQFTPASPILRIFSVPFLPLSVLKKPSPDQDVVFDPDTKAAIAARYYPDPPAPASSRHRPRRHYFS